MKTLKGQPTSPGYAEGTAFVYNRGPAGGVPRYQIDRDQVDAEHDRFLQAMERSAEELQSLRSKIKSELGQAEADIFAAHLSLLHDESFRRRTRERIDRDLVNVEQAVDAEISDLAKALEEVENEYIRERAKDVHDVKRRVLKHLGHGPEEDLKNLPPGSILVAAELFPSDTLGLDREHVSAIVMEHGGETGHAAILARAMGIPAVTGAAHATEVIKPGDHVHVDGQSGEVTVTPSEEAENAFVSFKARRDDEAARAADEYAGPCTTRDGTTIQLLANISRPEEASLPEMASLEGIGLFRTEYLFLGRAVPPTERQQEEVYSAIAAAVAPRPTVIRTLDLGGDKKPAFLVDTFEANPNLGMRGLRFSLAERELFQTQLRAIARTALTGNVRVLFPMVLGTDDFCAAADLFRQACHEIELDDVPQIGAMIETPSAVFELDRIAAEADFLSVGTNDLVQYVLAADRNTEGLTGRLGLHPAMVRVLRHIAEGSSTAEREVSVCGELAGVSDLARLLVGLGFRSLSMAPRRSPAVRRTLCESDLAELEGIARRAVHCRNENEVSKLLGTLGSGLS
ncbi:MAG: phosphoenolpyruvate--protein phosphotransferase [Planctomycetes bacterium]|jgi:phosphotransferase system enzyme I (PtsI)|nr:phosphoenolpyruvate--protein phosphotransferase [Planctomycetota bacterium]